jgi:hypothetical protein
MKKITKKSEFLMIFFQQQNIKKGTQLMFAPIYRRLKQVL